MVDPKFQLYITTDRNVRLLGQLENRLEAGLISIAYTLNGNIVTKHEDEAHLVLVLGHVIIGNDIRTHETVAHARNGSLARHCVDYNGLWLVISYEKATGRLHVINDRFASYPLYLFQDDDALHLSLNYGDIHSTVGRAQRFDRFAVYEFLSLRRLMGEKTYDMSIATLRGATHLIYDTAERQMSSEEYWKPSFVKSMKSQSDLEDELVSVIEDAVRKRLTDGKRYGILLSGGVDSRAVLMTAGEMMTAFTNCDWKNNEYDVANKIAHLAGRELAFVQRPADYYGRLEQVARKFTGGMYPLSEAGWILPEYVPPMYEKVDAMFHGCGLDYLVGDNYTPHGSFAVGRYAMYTRTRRVPGSDLIGDFLQTISWRFKDFDSMEWFDPACRQTIADSLRASLSSVMDRGLRYTDDPTDLYLYFTIHNPSRHSMYFGPMMTRAYVDERCPGWDNDYFDFCLALPHRYRSNWNLYRRSLAKRYPDFLEIREANTNISPRHSSVGIDIRRICHALKCMIGLSQRRPFNSRSWPVMGKVVAPPIQINRAEMMLMDNFPELSRNTVRRVLASPYETIAKNLMRTLICFLEDNVASVQNGT